LQPENGVSLRGYECSKIFAEDQKDRKSFAKDYAKDYAKASSFRESFVLQRKLRPSKKASDDRALLGQGYG